MKSVDIADYFAEKEDEDIKAYENGFKEKEKRKIRYKKSLKKDRKKKNSSLQFKLCPWLKKEEYSKEASFLFNYFMLDRREERTNSHDFKVRKGKDYTKSQMLDID